MARFDVYRHRDGAGFLLDVQADILEGLNTRVVVPLMAVADAPTPAKRLNPRLVVVDQDVVMVTQYLAAVPTAVLGPPVASLRHHHDAIIDALDFLMQGF